MMDITINPECNYAHIFYRYVKHVSKYPFVWYIKVMIKKEIMIY